MTEGKYRNRRAWQIENETMRVTVLVEGGHIAEILHKPTGVNPLWTPPWASIEPSAYAAEKHPEYGAGCESRLLAGIMGHNLCLDLFGGPSAEEAAAGITAHGEASVAPYSMRVENGEMIASATMKHAQLHFERRLRLAPDGETVSITETVENRSALDRPIAWTQHVTLGPPFLQKGSTQFQIPGTKSKVYESAFGDGNLIAGAEFAWPWAPQSDGGRHDLRVYTDAASSSAYTAHLMDPGQEEAFFVAFAPETKVAFGYRWKRADFPWLGIWDENQFRRQTPWNGKTITRGMEFGVSPMPETRRKMIERGSLFGVPGYRWLPASGSATVAYSAFVRSAESI